jgi:hypothetical protein
MVIRIFGMVLVIWAITSVLAIALRCGLSRPWTNAKDECLDMVSVPGPFLTTIASSFSKQTSLSDGSSAIDIMIDLVLIALPMVLVWNLHMKRHEKVIVSLAFAFRIM